MGLIVMIISCVVAGLAAQTREAPVPVFVTHSGGDEVGQALVYNIREQLRQSTGLPLAADPEKAAVHLHVISVDSSCERPGSKSAVSLLLVVNNQASSLLSARVVDLGVKQVSTEAQFIVSKIDAEIAAWRAKAQ